MDESRYREVERALWAHVGAEPVEHRVRLATDGIEVRVQEVGDPGGAPVLFVHGGPNAGSTFAAVAARLPRRRVLVVDRPGTGLSDPLPVAPAELPAFGDRFTSEVLDGLGVERADVVGSSFGGYLSLRGAAARPARFRRMVQLACPALVPAMVVPPILRFMASPLGRVLGVVPGNERGALTAFRHLGHGASVAAGRIDPLELRWAAALQSHTDTFRHDLANLRRYVVRGRVLPGLTLDAATLSRVTCPTLVVWGADDPFGGAEVGARLRDALPDAELVVLPERGHLPWLDGPEEIAALVEEHLAAPVGAAS